MPRLRIASLLLASTLLARVAAADCVVACPIHNGTCGVQIVLPDDQCGGVATLPTPDPQVEKKAREEAERQRQRERQDEANQRSSTVRTEKLRDETRQMKLVDHQREEAERLAREGAAKSRSTREAESSAYGQLLNADEAKGLRKDPYDTAGKDRGAVKITGSAAALPLSAPKVAPENRAKVTELSKKRDDIAAKIAEAEKTLAATDASDGGVKQAQIRQQITNLTSEKNTLQVHIDDLSARPPSKNTKPAKQPPPLVPPEPGK